MTSMSRVATEGSVSGSRLVTQNMLLGLDNGWMMGRGAEEQRTHHGDSQPLTRPKSIFGEVCSVSP